MYDHRAFIWLAKNQISSYKDFILNRPHISGSQCFEHFLQLTYVLSSEVWSMLQITNLKSSTSLDPTIVTLSPQVKNMFVWGILCHFDLPTAFNQ